MKMMKKVLLVVLCLMFAAASFAQTSGPSNVAGYVKFTAPGTVVGTASATPFGLPFQFWDVDDGTGIPTYGVESFRPSDIIGDQATSGSPVGSDKILQQEGNQAFRNSSNGDAWEGNLETDSAGAGSMIPGEAYWFINKSGAPIDVVLAGEVNNAGNYQTVTILKPTSGTNRATPYSWRDSRLVPLDSLDLIAQGFTGGATPSASDRLVEQGGSGNIANYLIGTGWDNPAFPEVTPGAAYWIVHKHPSGVDWDYNYVGVPVLPLTADDNEGVVSSARSDIGTSIIPTFVPRLPSRLLPSARKMC
jgi:hypothetical protein